MKLERGDIVLASGKGDYGKPRPTVIVQASHYIEGSASMTVCPISSDILDASFFRVDLKPTKGNGLKVISQIMVDKISSYREDRIKQKIGTLTPLQLHAVNEALKEWLGLF